MKQAYQVDLHVPHDPAIPFDLETKMAEALQRHLCNIYVIPCNELRATVVCAMDVHGNILEHHKRTESVYNRAKVQFDSNKVVDWTLYYIVSTPDNERIIHSVYKTIPPPINPNPKETATNILPPHENIV